MLLPWLLPFLEVGLGVGRCCYGSLQYFSLSIVCLQLFILQQSSLVALPSHQKHRSRVVCGFWWQHRPQILLPTAVWPQIQTRPLQAAHTTDISACPQVTAQSTQINLASGNSAARGHQWIQGAAKTRDKQPLVVIWTMDVSTDPWGSRTVDLVVTLNYITNPDLWPQVAVQATWINMDSYSSMTHWH